MSEQPSEYKIEGRPATIFRTVKDKNNPYVVVDRRIVDNDKLSFKAKGILLYLLSRPDGWEVNLVDLANRSIDGLASVKSGVRELKDAGYLRHTGLRKESGQFDTVIWEVHEVPQVGNQLTVQPQVGVSSPQVDYPHVDKPHAVNRMQVLSTLSTNDLSINTTTGEIFKIFSSEIHPITSVVADKIGIWMDDPKIQDGWIVDAIKEASIQNKRNWAYCEAILKRWKTEGKTPLKITTRINNRQAQIEKLRSM
jgi:DnaD/phage-associated family protein